MAKVDEWARDGMSLTSPLADTSLRVYEVVLTPEEKVNLAMHAASYVRRFVCPGSEPGTPGWYMQVRALRDLLEALGVFETTYAE